MLRVLLTSGRELAAVTTEDLLGKDVEGHSTVRKLKQYLHGLTGHSRFQQRLVFDGRQLQDEDFLEPPLCMQLVIISFCEASPVLVKRLAEAIEGDNTEVVEELLQKPLDPKVQFTWPDGTPEPAVHLAAAAGSVRSAQLLLEAGANKDEQDFSGATPLHVASSEGHVAFVQWLLDAGVDTSQTDRSGGTPLYYACALGKVDVVHVLIEAGGMKDELMPDLNSALHAACAAGQTDVVSCLVQAGADKDAAGLQGNTPLHMACMLGELQVVRYLVHAGSMRDALNECGMAPIHLACQRGKVAVVQYLVESSHSRDILTVFGWSPLHVACMLDGPGTLEVVDYLILSGANINQPTSRGLTPLGKASLKGNFNKARRLLLAGADIGRHRCGHSPLILAGSKGHVRVVELLQEAQAHPKRRRLTFKQPGKTSMSHEA